MFSYKRVPLVEPERDDEASIDGSSDRDVKPRMGARRDRAAFLKTTLSLLKDGILILLALQGLWSVYRTSTSSSMSTCTSMESTEQHEPDGYGGVHYDMHHGHGVKNPGKEDNRSCNCGSSVSEALSRGCKYDSMAAGWLPEHCRDDELTAEFEAAGDGPDGSWIYWLDKNHTQEISIEELALKGDDHDFRFHMSIEWHKVHCIFYWLKEHRSRFNGKMVERRSDTEGHIKHCGMILTGMTGPGTVAGVELNMDEAE